ncbi:unnamed protein product [Mesocestoides corti]|uniref:Phospholipase B-like n=2 Tax=Mesocestoides corti TaxID=53468 RepID=A0A3P6H3L1_MESCO|nr:unnamed protein product [Mesocestoides corti]
MGICNHAASFIYGTMAVVVLSLLCVLTAHLSIAIDLPNNTACVIASRLEDGSYNFSLESDISPQHRSTYDFIIPAAVWFNESLSDLGMAFQTVKTSGDIDDTIQAYWAGFLELHISREITNAHFENTWAGFCEGGHSAECKVLEGCLKRNLEMTIRKSVQSGDIDPYWHQMELILWQLRGVIDAWENVTVENSKTLTTNYLMQLVDKVLGLYLLQLSGDMGEIAAAVGIHEIRDGGPDGRRYFLNRPSCSALVKLTPDRKDVFISHSTWQDYKTMLKVMKYYEFAWRLTRSSNAPLIPSEKIMFSSYPSTVASIDDFYITSAGLVVQETTNGNENPALWPFVRHGLNNSVLEVFRVMIANRLARTPSEWISFFSRDNSGTYNNQWMVFDTKVLDPEKPLPTQDLFWVAEQIPGFIQSADVTEHLINQSYWGSYNIPYFEFIHQVSGFDDLEKKYGDVYSHEMAARARIFRRDHVNAVSLPLVYRLMRYNNFMHDPLSQCNCTPPYTAQYAIAARSDLNDPNGTYPLPQLGFRLHGATDLKLVNLALARSSSMIAVSGPTYEEVPVFEWSGVWPDTPRPSMHPNRWNFPPVLIQVENYDGPWVQPLLHLHPIQP